MYVCACTHLYVSGGGRAPHVSMSVHLHLCVSVPMHTCDLCVSEVRVWYVNTSVRVCVRERDSVGLCKRAL